jgi:hypothetical protein
LGERSGFHGSGKRSDVELSLQSKLEMSGRLFLAASDSMQYASQFFYRSRFALTPYVPRGLGLIVMFFWRDALVSSASFRAAIPTIELQRRQIQRPAVWARESVRAASHVSERPPISLRFFGLVR